LVLFLEEKEQKASNLTLFCKGSFKGDRALSRGNRVTSDGRQSASRNSACDVFEIGPCASLKISSWQTIEAMAHAASEGHKYQERQSIGSIFRRREAFLGNDYSDGNEKAARCRRVRFSSFHTASISFCALIPSRTLSASSICSCSYPLHPAQENPSAGKHCRTA